MVIIVKMFVIQVVVVVSPHVFVLDYTFDDVQGFIQAFVTKSATGGVVNFMFESERDVIK